MPAAAGSRMRERFIAAVMDVEPGPAEQDPGMLHTVVGIDETGADRADLRAIEQAAQSPVPAVAEHDHVVIGEYQQRGIGGGNGADCSIARRSARSAPVS